MTRADLVGKIGSVTTRVRGGELAGEVRIVVSGLPHYYLAYCPHVPRLLPARRPDRDEGAGRRRAWGGPIEVEP